MTAGKVSAILPLAGASRRMGTVKALLPWGETSVLGAILSALTAGGVDEVLVVTGHHRAAIEDELSHLRPLFGYAQIKTVHNPQPEAGDMLGSVQCGLAALGNEIQAALITLGDQPQMQAETVRALLAAWVARRGAPSLVVPSYRMRRGHPWLVSRHYWEAILALRPPQTLRDFLGQHAAEIIYLTVETPTVLQDLDTPEDYRQQRP